MQRNELEDINHGSLLVIKDFLQAFADGTEIERHRVAAEFVLDYVDGCLECIAQAKKRGEK